MTKNINITKSLLAKAKKIAMKKCAVFNLSKKSNAEVAAEIRCTRDPFLKSFEWKRLRKSVIETYGAKCMKCAYVPKDLRKINVDHIKPRKYFPELALDFDNLQVLCTRCNKEKGNKHQTDYRLKEST